MNNQLSPSDTIVAVVALLGVDVTAMVPGGDAGWIVPAAWCGAGVMVGVICRIAVDLWRNR